MKPENSKSQGLVFDSPLAYILDTREMPWEDYDPQRPGTRKRKVLARNEAGEATVILYWIPAGPLMEQLPFRTYHKTVQEYYFVLSGELPHWEYASPDDGEAEGKMVVFKPGYFLERKPGSIHGVQAGPVPEIGCLLLHWRNGIGNEPDDPNFDTESAVVPFPPADRSARP